MKSFNKNIFFLNIYQYIRLRIGFIKTMRIKVSICTMSYKQQRIVDINVARNY